MFLQIKYIGGKTGKETYTYKKEGISITVNPNDCIEVPKVTGISVSSNNIVESVRNDSGSMIHELIGKKQTVSASFATLTNEEKELIYDLTSQNSGLDLDIKFNDPETHTEKEINCYIGDRSIGIALTKDGKITHWNGFSLTFTEN